LGRLSTLFGAEFREAQKFTLYILIGKDQMTLEALKAASDMTGRDAGCISLAQTTRQCAFLASQSHRNSQCARQRNVRVKRLMDGIYIQWGKR